MGERGPEDALNPAALPTHTAVSRDTTMPTPALSQPLEERMWDPLKQGSWVCCLSMSGSWETWIPQSFNTTSWAAGEWLKSRKGCRDEGASQYRNCHRR